MSRLSDDESIAGSSDSDTDPIYKITDEDKRTESADLKENCSKTKKRENFTKSSLIILSISFKADIIAMFLFVLLEF